MLFLRALLIGVKEAPSVEMVAVQEVGMGGLDNFKIKLKNREQPSFTNTSVFFY